MGRRSKYITCCNYILYIYLIIYCLLGLALAISLSYLLLRNYNLNYFLIKLQTLIFVSYFPSVIIFALTCLGWSALRKKKTITMKIFTALVFLNVVAQISLSIILYLNYHQLPNKAKTLLQEKFQISNFEDAHWDIMQSQLQCCGVMGLTDYVAINQKIPFSCCDQNSNSCYPQGCLQPFTEFVKSDFTLLSLTFFIASIIQLPIAIIAWNLAGKMQRDKLPKTEQLLLQPAKIVPKNTSSRNNSILKGASPS